MAEHGLASAIKLASNEVSYGPLPGVVEAVTAALSHSNRYPDHRATALREALAARLGRRVEELTVGDGSVGLLQQLYLTYAGAGDEVVYPWPSFEAYPVYAGLCEAAVVTTPLERYTFDMDAVIAAVTDRTKLVLLAVPNNPTGTAVPLAGIERLLRAAPPTCLVVVDEAYREFVTRADFPDSLPLLDRHPNLLILRTFSKAWGLAALRVGYAIAHEEVIAALDKTLVPFAVNDLAQQAALASLRAEDEMRARVSTVLGERARVVAALGEMGWSVPDAQANFVFLPAGTASADLVLTMERLGVVTRPFAGFGVRVTIGSPEENDRFLQVFAKASTELDPSVWGLPLPR